MILRCWRRSFCDRLSVARLLPYQRRGRRLPVFVLHFWWRHLCLIHFQSRTRGKTIAQWPQIKVAPKIISCFAYWWGWPEARCRVMILASVYIETCVCGEGPQQLNVHVTLCSSQRPSWASVTFTCGTLLCIPFVTVTMRASTLCLKLGHLWEKPTKSNLSSS